MKFISAPFGNYIHPRSALAVTGTWTVKPRPGRFKQVLKTVRYSFEERGWINRLGLRNVGIHRALDSHDNQREVLSVAAIDDNDWKILSDIIPPDYNIELNLSCPNVDESSPTGITNMINESRQWCIAKVPPGAGTDKLIDDLVDMGFTTIHACNAIPHARGAISGKQVKACSLNVIRYIKRMHPHVEVIGGGGITNISDIEDYYDVGADHVSLGSVCFTPWKLPALLRR